MLVQNVLYTLSAFYKQRTTETADVKENVARNCRASRFPTQIDSYIDFKTDIAYRLIALSVLNLIGWKYSETNNHLRY